MKALVAMLVLLCAWSPSMAAKRVVDCEVNAYRGKCVFDPERGGSFSLSNPAGEGESLDGSTVVTVSIVQKGVAKASALTTSGVSSRWGEAKRSRTDPACWVGADFKVCAW